MHQSLTIHGVELIHSLLGESSIQSLKEEFSRLSTEAGSPCVRHVLDRSEPIRDLATSPGLLGSLPNEHQAVRCILFDKTPDSNWPVAWHQDLTIAVKTQHSIPGYDNWSIKDNVTHVQPPIELLEQMVTVRIHLDDTPPENGALRVITGSHQKGRIPSDQIPALTQNNLSTCSCKPGDALLMKPLILHASNRSLAPDHRRVIHIEYANPSSLDESLEWYDQI